MKIALFIEDGLEQIVLTPQSDIERSILRKLDDRNLSIRHGDFYKNQGGWVMYNPHHCDHKSTILVLTEPDPEPVELGDRRLSDA